MSTTTVEVTAPAPQDGLPDLAEPVPYEDITVVVLAGKPRLTRLDLWAQTWANDPELARCPVVVLYRGRDEDDMRECLAPLPHATLTRMPERLDETDESSSR